MYRERFDAAGVHPDDVTDLSDLAKFPFTAKGDLRDQYPFGMFAVPEEKIIRVHAPPEQLENPQLLVIPNTILMWADLVARSLRASGVRAGDLGIAPMAMDCSRAALGRITELSD